MKLEDLKVGMKIKWDCGDSFGVEEGKILAIDTKIWPVLVQNPDGSEGRIYAHEVIEVVS